MNSEDGDSAVSDDLGSLGSLPDGVEWLMVETPEGCRIVVARDAAALVECRMATTPALLAEVGYGPDSIASVSRALERASA